MAKAVNSAAVIRNGVNRITDTNKTTDKKLHLFFIKFDPYISMNLSLYIMTKLRKKIEKNIIFQDFRIVTQIFVPTEISVRLKLNKY